MKKLSLVLVAILFAVTGIFAQTPEMFKYQTVLRNASGVIMASENVTVDISILQGSASGTSVFTEQHSVTTTAQGLINLNIGSVADLSVVDFSADTYFIEISVNSTVMGTSQLLSVPYALQAKEVENVDYSQITNTPANATTIADGFMSSADKTKLDGLQNANITAGTGISVLGTYPDITITNTATGGTHYLGEEYLGGIIFYLYTGSDGQQHGLVVSKTETTAKWQNTAVLVNADKTSNGAYNTNLMTDSPARTWVETLGAGWYLPSIDELSILWHNRFHVNNSTAIGFVLMSRIAHYWSSTEYDADNGFGFFSGGYVFYDDKTSTLSVRGVRAF